MSRTGKTTLFGSRAPKLDMSPMIDLVFLLLIFFMVSSRLITFTKDPNVVIPIASKAKVPKMVNGRVILNVYADGTIKDESGTETYTLDQVMGLMAVAKRAEPNVRLHLRADRNAIHKMVKDVIDAAARGGVNEVIFSTYVTE